jgi:hypothetical protein
MTRYGAGSGSGARLGGEGHRGHRQLRADLRAHDGQALPTGTGHQYALDPGRPHGADAHEIEPRLRKTPRSNGMPFAVTPGASRDAAPTAAFARSSPFHRATLNACLGSNCRVLWNVLQAHVASRLCRPNVFPRRVSRAISETGSSFACRRSGRRRRIRRRRNDGYGQNPWRQFLRPKATNR